jgi:hypothetical protein
MNILQLKNILKDNNLYLTDKEIAAYWQMDKSAFSKKQKAGTEIKQKHLQILENVYNIKLIGSSSNNNLVNVLPCCASCGNGITIDSSLIYNYNPSAKYTFVVARGDSMEKTICNSDICIVKNCSEFASDGVYCFSIGDDLYIKRVVKNINQIECISDNPVYDKITLKGQEMDKINIIGLVVNVIRSL